MARNLTVEDEARIAGSIALDHVWGLDVDPGSDVVDAGVGYPRKMFGASTISTVRGLGYRYRA